MKKSLLFIALGLMSAMAHAYEVSDTIVNTLIGVSDETGTKPQEFSGLSIKSDATYAGYIAGNYNTLLIKSSSGTGKNAIYTTETGGKLKKIIFKWNSHSPYSPATETVPAQTTTVFIYGKHTPYTSNRELYSDETAGDSIFANTWDTINYVITCDVKADYEYFGIRSKGTAYLDYVIAVWENGKETPSAIESASTPSSSSNKNIIYNLSGLRVDENYKGIVIINGKKVYQK